MKFVLWPVILAKKDEISGRFPLNNKAGEWLTTSIIFELRIFALRIFA